MKHLDAVAAVDIEWTNLKNMPALREMKSRAKRGPSSRQKTGQDGPLCDAEDLCLLAGLGSSALQVTGAKALDVIAMLLGCAGQ